MKISQVNNGIVSGVKHPINNNYSLDQKTQVYKQINELSNICYKPVSFGWSVAEHESYGAQIDPKTKNVSFKLFTYPDAQKVTVTVVKRDNEKIQKTFELKNKGNGIFRTEQLITQKDAAHGDKYFYTITKKDGQTEVVKDPYSYRQEKLLDESTLYDHSLFEWSDSDWFSSNKARVSRKADSKNGLTPVNDLRIYEFNTATLTELGTLEAAKAKLKEIKDMGFNAYEIMPLENTFSFNWGYDGVDKMAPSEHLGGPDGAKELINEGHKLGLNGIMDMVPNHLGPDGASLHRTGPYIGGNNDFGSSFNFEGKDSRYVRDYIVNAALNWLKNYHCDGLRLDMTKYMQSDYTMQQIAAEVNRHFPDAILIAEDARDKVSVDKNGHYWHNNEEPHDCRVTTPLSQAETGEGLSEGEHIAAIQNISDFKSNLGKIGFDSEWDFNFYHALEQSLYGNVDLDKFEKANYCAQNRVKYVMSHDEIGNHEGTRLVAKLMVPMLDLNNNMISQEKVTRDAQFAAEKLAMMLQKGELEKYKDNEAAFKHEVLQAAGIRPSANITYDDVVNAFNTSFEKNKMAYARTYAIPGPVMVFQGDEKADLTPFRFFREFDSIKHEEYLYKEKGYNTGKPALMESKLGRIKYSQAGKKRMNQFKELVKDLNIISSENKALSNGTIIAENTVKHPVSQVIATHAKHNESNNEIFAITNFKNTDYPQKGENPYYIKFPEGKWVEILNTDDRKYGGDGQTNDCTIISQGPHKSGIKLPGNATLIFKRVG